MNGCLPADCDIPKMKRNSYQVAIADAPLVPKHTSKVNEKDVGESELFVKRNHNNNLEDVFLATNSPTRDVTDSSAKLTSTKQPNSKNNTPIPFEKPQKYRKLQVVEKRFIKKSSSHLLYLDREAFRRSKRGISLKNYCIPCITYMVKQKMCLNFKKFSWYV